jgi:formamidopyrimidine-DNA glycosylase
MPEVETVRVRLAPFVEGRRIDDARILDARLVAPRATGEIEDRLRGRRIEQLERRGKYLVARLDDGGALLVHLRMTGNLLHGAAVGELPHLRALLHLDDGGRVAFTDVRRFGTWHVAEEGELEPYLASRLGPEPLERGFGPAVLAHAFAGRRAPVKALLLDQRVLAGVGNIYADEALHRARVHPQTPAGRVSRPALGRLAESLVSVLETGVASQGASIRDYRTPNGGYGSMQERFQVFDRTGEPCPRCGTPIVKLVVAGRGTHVCPRCQRRRR